LGSVGCPKVFGHTDRHTDRHCQIAQLKLRIFVNNIQHKYYRCGRKFNTVGWRNKIIKTSKPTNASLLLLFEFWKWCKISK